MADFKHNLNATTDVLNRGLIASNLGGPADMANVLANLARAGYGFAGRELGLLRADQLPELVEKPAGGGSVGSSEADEPTLGGFLSDPQSWKDMARNAGALGNRLATQIAGGPADLAMLPAHVLRGLNNIGRAAVGAEPQAELPEPAMGSAHFQRLAKDYLGAPTSTGDDAADALFDVSSMVAGLNPGKTARLVKAPARALRELAEAPGPAAGGPAAQRGAVKLPGGNWVSGNVENQLRGLNVHVRTPGVNGHTEMNAAQDEALNGWVNKQLGRYIKSDLGTDRDPMLGVLDNGGTIHINPEEEASVRTNHMAHVSRSEAKMPADDSGKTRPANAWSRRSDAAIEPSTVKDELRGHDAYQAKWPDAEAEAAVAWMRKVDPNTPIFSVERRHFDNLGFDHLKDELRNALDPNSGLPRELQLTPQQLSRVSVPQAAELVGKINKWRAEQKVLADAARANNAATVTHMELPGGMRWVELKAQQGTNPAYLGNGMYEDPNMNALQDALKYEGDTMGHCVGGYCDDVAAGRSRIFSLRDDKGLPHVTIEMTPDRSNTVKSMQAGTPSSFRIKQIKGKGNRGVAPKYQQHVLDFLHNTPHSTAEDLKLNGIHDVSADAGAAAYHSVHPGDKVPNDYNHVLFNHAQRNNLRYMTTQQIRRALGLQDFTDIKYAEGGAVLQKPVMGGGWDSDYYGPEGQARYQRDLDAYNAQQAALEAAKPKLIAKDVFMAAVKPEMLDAQGKFKGPDAGVNFMLEGWTPEEAYTTASGIANGGDWTEDNRLGKPASIEQANALLDPRWREGPNNGGGVLGGLTRGVGGMVKHLLVENPATSMALTAGLAPSMGNLLQGAGMSASTAKLAAPMLTSAGKTLVGGGNLADAAKGAALSYLGNEVGGQVAGATGSDTAGQLAKAAFGTAARGRGLSIDALAMQYATGKIADLSGLPPQVATLVVNLARSKRPTTGALSQAYRQYQPAQQY